MEDEYKRLIEEIRDVYFIIQQERLVLVSNYTTELYGYSENELIGKHFLELVAPEERERLSKYYRMRIEGKHVPERYESVFLTKDGTRIPGEVSVWLTRFQDKPAVAGIVLDITERKLIMEKLRDSEEKYRNIVENSPDIIYTADPEGVVHSVNNAVKDILGYAPEEVIGMKFMDFIPPQAMTRVMEDHDELCGGKNVTSSTLTIRKDGEERHLEFRSVPFIKDGTVVLAQGVIRDITDRMRAEEKLRRMFESVTDGVTVTNLEGFITELNAKTAEIHGFRSRNDLLGKNALELIAPCDHQSAVENMQKILDLGLIRDIEYKLLREDGSEFLGELSASVLNDVFGKPEGFIAITRDITERRRSEEELRESAEMLRLMFEYAPYGVTIIDLDAIIIDANDQALKLCGCNSKGEILGRSALDFIPKEQRIKAMKDIDQCFKEGIIIGFEYTIQKDDNSLISAQISAGVLRGIDDKPIGLISITRDITEEKQLRENKQFYISEIIKAQENERKNLARALHDDTVQELLLASHRLQDAISGNHGRLPKHAQWHLENLRTLIENVMAEVRGFSVDLRPGVLDDMGLIPALRWLTKRLSEGEGIDSGLKVQGNERRLPAETELTLFRIVQESLSNVRKHACASNAKVTLQFDENKVILMVIDNGRGFELPRLVSQFTREHKLGLTGIAERVSLLGGKYKLESSPGRGTAVRVEIDG